MALIDLNFFSYSFYRSVGVKVFLPVDKISLTEEVKWDKKPFKTLYLLHGVFDDYNSWINNSSILRYANDKNIAVVMPSGENMFYLNAPGRDGKERCKDTGGLYSKFIGEELVEFTKNIFPLSKKREDTFIAGLSMGGFGAIVNGVKYHNTFSHIAALSPALMIDDSVNSSYNKNIMLRNREFFESFLGDLSTVKESDKNPYYLVKRLKEENASLPKFYLACGKSDHLFPRTEEFANFLMEEGCEFIFEKGSGDHDWIFWDTYIQHVLDWLPCNK